MSKHDASSDDQSVRRRVYWVERTGPTYDATYVGPVRSTQFLHNRMARTSAYLGTTNLSRSAEVGDGGSEREGAVLIYVEVRGT